MHVRAGIYQVLEKFSVLWERQAQSISHMRKESEMQPVCWEFQAKEAMEPCLKERSSKKPQAISWEHLQSVFPALILLKEQFISKDFLKSSEEVCPSGS